MATTAVPIPQGAEVQGSPTPTAPPPNRPEHAAVPIPQGAEVTDQAPSEDIDKPEHTGFVVNDVGNRVIVPKEGESFSDTVKRAIEYHKSLTPEQQNEAMKREVATMPEKTAETLVAAPTLGAAGAALLASPGEASILMQGAGKALIPALAKGTEAVATWAEAHPVAAKMIYESVKAAIAGTVAGKMMRIGEKSIGGE